MSQAILIFAKNPLYGKVKTRLAVSVGKHMALCVYRQLLKHTASITNDLPFNKIVFYSDYVEQYDTWDDEIYQKKLQSGNDLGERMENAFSEAFKEGYLEVIIIGTDCLEINSEIIIDAFNYLKIYDLVIGPATDDGYYLLGMKKYYSELFRDISWSTDEVLKQTLSIAHKLKLAVYKLPVLSDVDDANDLTKMQL